MTIVLEVDESIHLLIAEKQMEIRKKYGKRIDMKQITNAVIKSAIDRAEEELGLINDKAKQ